MNKANVFLPLSFIIIFSFGVEHNVRIFGALFFFSGLSIVSSLHKSLGWSIHDFPSVENCLVWFVFLKTADKRRACGRSRVRTQFLRKISEVNLGNIPIPSKK